MSTAKRDLELENAIQEFKKGQTSGEIDISFTKLDEHKINYLIKNVYHLKLDNINFLSIKACNLTDDTFKLLIDSLRFINGLIEIDVSLNDITTLEYLNVLDVKNIEKLSASECHFVGKDALPVELFSKMPKLKYLELKFNTDNNILVFTLDFLYTLNIDCSIIMLMSLIHVEIPEKEDSSKIINQPLETFHMCNSGSWLGHTPDEIMYNCGINYNQSPLIKAARA